MFPCRENSTVEENCSLLSSLAGSARPSTGGLQGAGPGKYRGFSVFVTCLFPQPTKVPCSIQYICFTKKSSLSNCKHPCCQHGTSPKHLLIATRKATMGLHVGCDEEEPLMLHCYGRRNNMMLRTGLAVCGTCAPTADHDHKVCL